MPKRDHGTGGVRALVLLVLASLALITLDARSGSPVDPVRDAVGTVGRAGRGRRGDRRTPVQGGRAQPRQQPRTCATTWPRSRPRTPTSAASSRTTSTDRNRLAELDGLVRTARDTGYALVPARVVGMGPAQSFSRTVTIDAGTDAGVKPDLTVVNADGLVGRVVRASRTTATVLLIVDSDSVVGGRLGSSMEIGFIKGRGAVGGKARLDLDLVDDAATPARKGDVVVTWGSRQGRPVRRRHPDRAGRVGLQHPARAVQAGGDRPVRRLQPPRPGRRRRAPRHPG